MSRIIQAHKCDHCNHISIRKSDMNRHERNCNYNPAARACITCVHFSNFEGERASHYEFGKAVDIFYRGMWCDGIADSQGDLGIELESLRKDCETWQERTEAR